MKFNIGNIFFEKLYVISVVYWGEESIGFGII